LDLLKITVLHIGFQVDLEALLHRVNVGITTIVVVILLLATLVCDLDGFALIVDASHEVLVGLNLGVLAHVLQGKLTHKVKSEAEVQALSLVAVLFGESLLQVDKTVHQKDLAVGLDVHGSINVIHSFSLQVGGTERLGKAEEGLLVSLKFVKDQASVQEKRSNLLDFLVLALLLVLVLFLAHSHW
jgi:hypothetical protein